MESGDVESLEYVSEEEALERYRELYEDRPELFETLEVGDLPASFEVVATDDDARHRLHATSSPAIDDVRSGRDDQLWAKCLLNDYVPDGELET